MTRFRSLATALLLCAPASADPLIPSPPLAPEVAALPRLAGDTATAGFINDALEDLDRRHLALVTCDGGTSDQPYRAVETLSEGYLSFDLGPDLRSHELLLLPVGLPYVDIACEGEGRVPADQLRATKFSPRLLEALTGSP
jgi:hypothetical protein